MDSREWVDVAELLWPTEFGVLHCEQSVGGGVRPIHALDAAGYSSSAIGSSTTSGMTRLVRVWYTL